MNSQALAVLRTGLDTGPVAMQAAGALPAGPWRREAAGGAGQ